MKKSLVSILLVVLLVAASLVACTPKPQPEPPQPDKSNVKFQTNTVTLYVGDTYQTVVEGLSDGETITSYDSNNPSVATVDGNGVVTAVAVGSATVKVVSSSNGQALLRVEVLSTDMVFVPYISIDKTDVSLQIGDRYAVGYSVTYNGQTVQAELEWTSSDSNVATVMQGVVSAVGAGKCVITVACTYNGYSVDVQFNLEVTSLGIAFGTNIDNKEVFVKDEIDVEVYVTDNGKAVTATNIALASSDSEVVTVSDDGTKLTAQSGGNAEITVNFSYNGNNYTLKRNMYVYGYKVVTVKALGKTDHTIRAKVYGDKITLQLNRTEFDGQTIKCWYVNGKKIDGNTFVMPDDTVTAEAKFTNQTEGNFTKQFTSSSLLNTSATAEYVVGNMTDTNKKANTDGNYVVLKSAVASQQAATRFNFDESVLVDGAAYVTMRVYLTAGTRLYLGTEKETTCLVCKNASSYVTGTQKAYSLSDSNWSGELGQAASLKIPLTNFASEGEFLSGITMIVEGTCYIDYIVVV